MNLKAMIKSCIRGLLAIAPKSNSKIMFESNSDFCDNTRAVYEYLMKNKYNKQYKLVWCVSDPAKFRHRNEKNVSFTSFRNKRYFLHYLFHVGTSKTVLYTHATPPLIDTGRQQVACLWHGTPLKQMEFKETNTDPFSFIVSASKWCSDALLKCFPVSEDKVKILGYPRCDLLFEPNHALDKLGINKTNCQKLLLWMPTFRQSIALNLFDSHVTQTGLPLLETMSDLIAFNSALIEKNIYMVIKLHPLQDLKMEEGVELSNIRMITNNDLEEQDIQLYHLVSHADALLTDYSSIYFDYLLLGRTIGFIIDDIDEYQEKRGFVVDNPLDFMPGQHIKNIAQLGVFLSNLSNDTDDFAKQRKEICEIMNQYIDDNSCKRLLDCLDITL